MILAVATQVTAATPQISDNLGIYLKACSDMMTALSNKDTRLMNHTIDLFGCADYGELTEEDIIEPSGNAGKPDFSFCYEDAEKLMSSSFDLALLDPEHAMRATVPDLNLHHFSLEPSQTYSFSVETEGITYVTATSGLPGAVPALSVAAITVGNASVQGSPLDGYNATMAVVEQPEAGQIRISVTNTDSEKRTFVVILN